MHVNDLSASASISLFYIIQRYINSIYYYYYVCMRICEFCHLFPPAHNGLLLRKAEQDLTCAQDALRAFAHGTSIYSLIRRLLGRVESALMLTPEENIPLNGNRTRVVRLRA